MGGGGGDGVGFGCYDVVDDSGWSDYSRCDCLIPRSIGHFHDFTYEHYCIEVCDRDGCWDDIEFVPCKPNFNRWIGLPLVL